MKHLIPITDEEWKIKATPDNLKGYFQDKINWKLYNALDDCLTEYRDKDKYYTLSVSTFTDGKHPTFHHIYYNVNDGDDSGGHNEEYSDLYNRGLIVFTRLYECNGLVYIISLDYGEDNNRIIDKCKRISNKFNMHHTNNDYVIRIYETEPISNT